MTTDRHSQLHRIRYRLRGVGQGQEGHLKVMGVRDQNKGDLALTALTLSVGAVIAGQEAVRWLKKRRARKSRADADGH